MTKSRAYKLFKKHYHNSLKLKEGGKAWDREMKKCEYYKGIVMKGVEIWN